MDNKEITNMAQLLTDRAFDREYGWLGTSIYGVNMEECHGTHCSYELKPKYQKIYDDMYEDYLRKLNNRYGAGNKTNGDK